VLYFSRAKLIIIYLIISFLFLSFSTNFINNKDQLFLSKKINLGLDLQGGSYLLLEVDSQPLIKQNLQTKLIHLRKLLKEQKIKYQNLKLDGQSIKFKISEENLKIFEELFLNKDNLINTFYNKYNSYEMNYSIKDNFVLINYSKYGVIEVKTSALNQSLEIVRRRIDEIGTNEPTIVKRGNDRILVELPGLDDPNRIKNLLGKTANLSFRIVSESDDAFGSELLFFEDGKSQLNVNKRVVMSGDNLTTAKPRFDSRNNETIVTFTLDRVGAK
ncbi:uncharacterized protein METZ01_LOCUS402451, partial [marine metagenome]